MSDDLPVKPKKNLILPTTPMFASIMAPIAARMHKQLCRVKRMKGREHLGEEWINVVKEETWGEGIDNENLKEASLNIGTVGMVVGIANPATVLRFMVSNDGNAEDNGIYHVSVMNLELLKEPADDD